MKIAVIIPSRTSLNLHQCVAAIQECEPGLSIVVVDDGLDLFGAASLLLAADSSVRVVSGEKPFIFSRNVNIGIRAAGISDGYVVLNDDARLKTVGGFTRLANESAAHPEYGVIGVTTDITGASEQWPQGTNSLREVAKFSFVGVYIPRSTIEKVGYLDERYCLDYGCEDDDYCEAVRRAGLRLAVHDACYLDHGSLISTYRGDPRTGLSYQRNYDLFLAKREYCDRTGEPFVAGAGMREAIAA